MFAKLKQYVKLVTPAQPEEEGAEPEPAEPDYDAADEKCLVRISNYREPVNIELSGDPANITGANMSQLSKDHHVSRTSAANPDGTEGASQKMETISETSSQRATKTIEAFELDKLS